MELKTDKEFVTYNVETDNGDVWSKIPAAVALEILRRSKVEHVDGRYVTGRMSFSDTDFKEQ